MRFGLCGPKPFREVFPRPGTSGKRAGDGCRRRGHVPKGCGFGHSAFWKVRTDASHRVRYQVCRSRYSQTNPFHPRLMALRVVDARLGAACAIGGSGADELRLRFQSVCDREHDFGFFCGPCRSVDLIGHAVCDRRAGSNSIVLRSGPHGGERDH